MAVVRYIEEQEWKQLLQYGERKASAPRTWPASWKSTDPRPTWSGHEGVLDTNVIISGLNLGLTKTT